MKQLLLILSIAYLIACCTSNNGKAHLYDLSNANDAFNYKDLHNKKDTDIYVYQLKDMLNRHDSFLYVNYGSYYLKQFHEQNLSLRPLAIETFRFSYCPFGERPVNITFDQNEIVIKLGTAGSLDPVYNINRLDSSEIIKFRFFERNFFHSRESFSEKRLKYYDSMLAKYPELTSIEYYSKLITKCADFDSLKFIYTTKRISLTNEQYASLLDSLKKSNFDDLPWRIDYPSDVTDGGGYTFEANTKLKFKYFVCFGLPIDSLPMTKFCKYLLHLAKVDKEINL